MAPPRTSTTSSGWACLQTLAMAALLVGLVALAAVLGPARCTVENGCLLAATNWAQGIGRTVPPEGIAERRLCPCPAEGETPTSNTRQVSNALHAARNTPEETMDGVRLLLMHWGQFVDHDLVLARSDHESPPMVVPILDPEDPLYHLGELQVPLVRVNASSTECAPPPLNFQTPHLDGSHIYGPTPERWAQLREPNGDMRTHNADGVHLPPLVSSEGGGGPVFPPQFDLGDPRGGEQPGLTALHTLFLREHNRLARLIRVAAPHWTGDQVWSKARQLVVMLLQRITYEEYLPFLLGHPHPFPLERGAFDVENTPVPLWVEFTGATFRYGHSEIPERLELRGGYRDTSESHSLNDLFFNAAWVLEDPERLSRLMCAAQHAQRIDPVISDSARTLLFGEADGALDLVVLNLQRSRQLQLGSYADLYRCVHGTEVPGDLPTFFSEPQDPTQLDPFTGLLGERPAAPNLAFPLGPLAGPTISKLVRAQFLALRDADDYHYRWLEERGDVLGGFYREHIVGRTLRDVILDNTHCSSAFFAGPNAFALD